MRQIILDTETTGLEPAEGHRIIEIGCVEMINRRLTGNNYHRYLQPDREIDDGAIEVHGITNEFLADKPRFADIVADFLDYIKGAQLVIHNAAFDIGFINHELSLAGKQWGRAEDHCTVLDTLAMARKLHPGQRNTLDALCKRYEIDNSHRELHGALLDAEILADVYLGMTGGQTSLTLEGRESQQAGQGGAQAIRRLAADRPPLPVLQASRAEHEAHRRYLETLAAAGSCAWLELESLPGDS